ncbi:putative deoxyribonuclease YcfH [Holospora curviuscula]|uniref:Putative deoxyribonuclease YcfH n=1 Tax=Holospora curviuscula TaxID=1082868 RepID=A0A2S5R6T1_9PROT|nr:putative deoxyribonuclease YcfH [Holospora curviuscula]
MHSLSLDRLEYVDSHCHLDRYENVDEILQRAWEAGVRCIVSISVHRENTARVIEISERFPWVYASAGLHPCDVDDDPLEDLESWLVNKALHNKVLALGETGIDLQDKSPPLARQLQAFEAHVNAALHTGLPLIVHIRGGFDAFFDFWKHWDKNTPLGVLHCFTGTWNQAKAVLDMGWYLSFSGIVTFKRNGALSEVAEKVPANRFILETDAPWLAPEPYRGRENEPSYLVYTAKKIAELRCCSTSEIQYCTTENFYRLFGKIQKVY